MTRFSAPYPWTIATDPDSITKKSLPPSPAANRSSPGSTARTRPRLRNRARWPSSRRGKAPLRSTASATPAPIGWLVLLLIVLHCVGRPHLGVVRIEPDDARVAHELILRDRA